MRPDDLTTQGAEVERFRRQQITGVGQGDSIEARIRQLKSFKRPVDVGKDITNRIAILQHYFAANPEGHVSITGCIKHHEDARGNVLDLQREQAPAVAGVDGIQDPCVARDRDAEGSDPVLPEGWVQGSKETSRFERLDETAS
ncbi:MAG: hypothetical protein AAF561_10615 [Planctomycetota bacterium]